MSRGFSGPFPRSGVDTAQTPLVNMPHSGWQSEFSRFTTQRQGEQSPPEFGRRPGRQLFAAIQQVAQLAALLGRDLAGVHQVREEGDERTVG